MSRLQARRTVTLRGAALISATVVAMLAATAPGASAASTPRSGGTATFLVSAEVVSMDPIASGQANQPHYYSVYDRLIYIDPSTAQLVPGLATSVTSNADATVWTIKLRSSLKFTDGTVLDAAAVAFNWDRIKASPTTPDRTVVGSFTSYDVVDPVTLRVTLSTATAAFPALIQGSLGMIASPTAVKKYGSKYGLTPEATVGAGPFRETEWVRSDHMTLERNPNYWGRPKPYLDGLVLKPVSDATQKASALQAGNADLIWEPILTPSDQALASAGFKYSGVTQDGAISVVYNVARTPLDDVRVRRALTLAIDPDDLNQKAAGGAATMATTYYTKSSPFYDPSVKQKSNDLRAAQRLIDSYVADHGGKPVEFHLMYTTSLANFGTATLQQWARLKNTAITADAVTPTDGLTRGSAGNFDAYYAASPLAPRSSSYPETFYAMYHTGESTNIQHNSDPALDKILVASRGATSVGARKEALSKITKTIVDQSLVTLIYRLQQRTYYAKNLRGPVPEDLAYPYTNALWFAKE